MNTQGMSQEEIDLLADLGEDGNPSEQEGESQTGRDDDTPVFVDVANPKKDDPAPTVDDDGNPVDTPAATPAAPAAAVVETALDEGEEDAPELYAVQPMDDYAEARAALRAQKAEIDTKWGAGELSDEERNTQIADIDSKLEEQQAAKVRADMLTEINEQNARRAQERAIEGIKATGKKAGIDYTDDGMVAMFNAKLDAVSASADHKDKPFAARLQEAHKLVAKVLGKDAAPAPAPPAKKADTRSPDLSKLPPTLSRVPPAQDPDAGGDEFPQLAGLSGEALERAVAKMTPAEQEAWLN